MSTIKSFSSLSVWYLENPASPRKVGAVFLTPRGTSLAFKYDPTWLANGFELSPDMPMFIRRNPNVGEILPSKGWDAPGAIDDAMPDRWGQNVIRIVDNPPRLTPLDFLYLVGDRRFAALGFSGEKDAYVPHAFPPLP